MAAQKKNPGGRYNFNESMFLKEIGTSFLVHFLSILAAVRKAASGILADRAK